jgi:hypothetical protein
MALRQAFAGFLFLALITMAQTAASAPWPSATFASENRKQCPRINLADLTDGTMTDEVDRMSYRLSPPQRHALRKLIHVRCAAEIGVFYCENGLTIRAFDDASLTPLFVHHLCRRYRGCTEPAAC